MKKNHLAIMLAAATAFSTCAPVSAAEIDVNADASGIIVEEAVEETEDSTEEVAEEGGIIVEEEIQQTEETEAEEVESEERAARDVSPAINGMVYATVNLPYADFYYGELTDLEAGTDVIPDLTADVTADAGYEATGMYDAVTSATATKSTKFAATYYGTEDGNVKIYGVKDTKIAIPEDLYNNILAAKEANETCTNGIYDIVDNMVISSEAFAEYKTMNADGTFSKMKTEVAVDSDAVASITTDSEYGHYQISFKNLDVTTSNRDAMMGAVIETSDGAKYGLKHLDNLWLQPQEIAFAVLEGYTVNHGGLNYIEWQRFQDIQSKTITSVTYLMADAPDVQVNTNLKCLELLADEQGTTSTATEYNSEGTVIALQNTVPADADYGIAAIKGNTLGIVDASAYSYDKSTGKLVLNDTCHPGTYVVTFQDQNNIYQNYAIEILVTSKVSASQIKAEYNKLTVTDSLTTTLEYLNEITGMTVNGVELTGAGLGTTAFAEDGTVNFAAKTSGHGAKNIFAEGEEGDYTVVLHAAGFPDVTIQVGKSYVYKEKTEQTIKATASYTKTYGNAAFSLNASAEGALSYQSSNTAVVTVDAAGKVTIKGAGTANITITAAETDDVKAAVKTVKITVNKANGSITGAASSVSKTYGNAAFSLNAASKTGTLSYKSDNTAAATVNAKGTVTLKGSGTAKITITAAASTNYNKATKTVTITVKPSKTTIKTAKASGKKAAVVTWSKNSSKVTGYQILLATNRAFSKNKRTVTVKSATTLKKTVKSLKSKKTYYVKVRAYKTSGKTTLYGAYSGVKQVKVK